jgi:hypothetical protein
MGINIKLNTLSENLINHNLLHYKINEKGKFLDWFNYDYSNISEIWNTSNFALSRRFNDGIWKTLARGNIKCG